MTCESCLGQVFKIEKPDDGSEMVAVCTSCAKREVIATAFPETESEGSDER